MVRLTPRRTGALLGGLVLAVALFSVAPDAAQAGVVSCDITPTSTELIQCDLCDLYATLQNVINILAGGLVGVGVLALVVGGFRYITSTGSPGLIETAKKTIQFAIAGIIIVSLAFVAIQITFSALAGNTGGIFSGIQCTTPEAGEPAQPPGTQPPPPTPGPPTEPPAEGADCEGTVGGCKNSPALSQFMSCFEGQLAGQGNVGSKNTYGDGHRENSCHYGGSTCSDGAHAVDYGGDGGAPSFSAQDAALIQSAANTCGAQVGGATVRGENASSQTTPIDGSATTHIHINVANQNCGCN